MTMTKVSVLLGLLLSLQSIVAAPANGGPKPILPQDFPDPGILQVGATWYAFSTNRGGRNVPVAQSSDPDSGWTFSNIDALPTLGAWASGNLWAPDVLQRVRLIRFAKSSEV